MGLGLTISRRLVELHGGQIGVLSTGADGTGSTFYFTLPILAVDASATSAGEDRTGEVLLLTERAGAGERLVEYLAARGFTVEIIAEETHPSWLGQILVSPPGAVVLDFEPAAEQWWELMQETCAAIQPHRNIPVVFYEPPRREEDHGVAVGGRIPGQAGGRRRVGTCAWPARDSKRAGVTAVAKRSSSWTTTLGFWTTCSRSWRNWGAEKNAASCKSQQWPRSVGSRWLATGPTWCCSI